MYIISAMHAFILIGKHYIYNPYCIILGKHNSSYTAQYNIFTFEAFYTPSISYSDNEFHYKIIK